MPEHDPRRDRPRTGQAHRRPAGRQARGGHRAAQPLAPPAGRRGAAQRDHAEEHPDDRPDRRRQDRDRAPPGASWPTRPSSRSRRPSSPRSAMSAAMSTRSSATWSTSAVKMMREQEMDKVQRRRRGRRRGPHPRRRCCRRRAATSWDDDAAPVRTDGSGTRQKFRKKLREGELDDKEIEIETQRRQPRRGDHGPAGHGGDDQPAAGPVPEPGRPAHARRASCGSRTRCKLLIRTRRPPSWSTRRTSRLRALETRRAERHRVPRRDRQGRQPQRAPGRATCRARACSATCCRWSRAAPCRPSTAWCKTDHILFIASGAFHLAKPSDLIPELQGRLPIRVELAR